MELRGIYPCELRNIVDQVSDEYGGNIVFNNFQVYERKSGPPLIRFTLKTKDHSGPGSKRSWTYRRTISACWHVHYRVMQAIFDTFPKAKLRAMLGKYDGKEDFEEKVQETRRVNVGSMIQPVRPTDLCDCGW